MRLKSPAGGLKSCASTKPQVNWIAARLGGDKPAFCMEDMNMADDDDPVDTLLKGAALLTLGLFALPFLLAASSGTRSRQEPRGTGGGTGGEGADGDGPPADPTYRFSKTTGEMDRL